MDTFLDSFLKSMFVRCLLYGAGILGGTMLLVTVVLAETGLANIPLWVSAIIAGVGMCAGFGMFILMAPMIIILGVVMMVFISALHQ